MGLIPPSNLPRFDEFCGGHDMDSDRKYRAAILKAARSLFATIGYERTRMDAIAVQSGVNKRFVYDVFHSKDGLYSTLLSEMSREVERKFRERLDGENEAARAWDAFLDVITGDVEFLRIWAWEMIAPSMPGMWILTAVQRMLGELERAGYGGAAVAAMAEGVLLRMAVGIDDDVIARSLREATVRAVCSGQ